MEMKLKSTFSLRNSYLSYFLMYNFYYLSWALFSALISVYLLDKGYRASDVSLVVSASFFTSLVAQPIIGLLSNHFKVKTINMVLFTLAAVGGVFFILADNLITIAICYSFVLMLINGTNPEMEKIATASPYQYGKIRIWGTIGYALGSQLAGLIYDYVSPSAIFVVFVITMCLTVVGTYLTDPKEEVAEKQEKVSTLTLFTNKKYLYFLVIYGLFTGITNVSNTYIAAMFQADGLTTSLVSTILSVAVLCELPIVFFSDKFMDKVSNKKLMLVACIMVALQVFCYGIDIFLPIKIIITFIVKHPFGMLFIMINLKVVNTLVDPSQQITALAFCATVKNLSSIVFSNIAGHLIDMSGYAYTYMVCFVVMLVVIFLVVSFKIPSGNDKKLFE
ncbi:MAG: MFS transporter [Erysipelotrichaceae bacterium]|nr:MFS transporter [Erysipelotrichaceae bacterium]